MKLFPLAAALSFSATLFAQEITINNLGPAYREYTFPEVKCASKPKVAEKINTFLQIEHLMHVPGMYKKHPFEKVMVNDDDCCWNIYFTDWTVHRNNNILSLSIGAEGTGAYTEYSKTYSNFETATGNILLADDLFTGKGHSEIRVTIIEKIKKKITDFLADNDRYKGQPDMENVIAEQQSMYGDCLDDLEETRYAWESFYFTGDSIIFNRGRCSAHVNRALDDLYDFHVGFRLADIDKYLSEKGRQIIYGQANTAMSNLPQGKIFKGTISKYPVTFVIQGNDTFDNSIGVMYWYDKKKIPIDLTGTFLNGTISLAEFHQEPDASRETAQITLQWTGNQKLVGKWVNSQTKEELPVSLELY